MSDTETLTPSAWLWAKSDRGVHQSNTSSPTASAQRTTSAVAIPAVLQIGRISLRSRSASGCDHDRKGLPNADAIACNSPSRGGVLKFGLPVEASQQHRDPDQDHAGQQDRYRVGAQ